MASTTAPGDDRTELDLRFVDRRRPTPAETAAVTAVVAAALEQRVPAAAETGTSDWVRSGGALRRPIETGSGRWQRSLR